LDLTPDAIAEQASRLLPTGAAWPRVLGSNLRKLLLAAGDELQLVYGRVQALRAEMHPGSATELLAEWEREYGLPDPCAAAADTEVERRAALASKYSQTGGQTIPYYVAVALSLGYVITIDEFMALTCDSYAEDYCFSNDWAYAWQVNAPNTTVRDGDCLSDCEQPLRSWGNELLECALTRIAPSHTIVIFSYGA
jgi:uncharacterized protein YmfQ (DUF2313 family)